ncbi:MAG: lysophospholipase [bacterium]|nr:lysophospholipase [bacterium]
MEEEFHLIAADGVQLEGTAWPAKNPRAVLPWLHGFAEHRKRYHHFASWMANQGIAVVAIDFRGHGASQGKRGHVKKFQEYLLDVRVFLNWVIKNFPDLPIVLGAHSNGGLIAARFLQEEGQSFDLRASVMTGPFFDVGTPVPPVAAAVGRFMSKIIPKLSIPTNIPPEAVSHNADIVRDYGSDPLVFKTATARWFVETVAAQEVALNRASEIKLPLLIMQGMADTIVNPNASRRFFENASSEDKEWIPYDGLRHEILNENEREQVYRAMLDWINGRI